MISGPDIWVSQDLTVAEGLDEILAANNNVAAHIHEDTLFLAWRSSPTHFASAK